LFLINMDVLLILPPQVPVFIYIHGFKPVYMQDRG
jgi:hypothetical protein